MEPFRAQRRLPEQIPGVDAPVTVVAEIGVDTGVFVNAARPAAWAGVCPGNDQSAGKRRSGATCRGNVHLKTALVTAAVSGSRRKDSCYKDKYHRLKARRGRLRAAAAIAHETLVAAYHVLAGGVPFREPGETFLDRQARQRNVRQLNPLGYDVLWQPKAAEAASPQGLVFGAVAARVLSGLPSTREVLTRMFRVALAELPDPGTSTRGMT